MRNFLNAWSRHSDAPGELAIGPGPGGTARAIKAGEKQVADAQFIYKMALAKGNYEAIRDAEKRLREVLSKDIHRKGGRMEDILMMHRSLHNGHPLGNLEKTDKRKLVVTIGLLILVGFLIRCGV